MNNSETKLVVFLIGVASVFIIFWGVQNSAPVLNPLLLATIITIAAIPLPRWFASKGLSGTLSIILTIVVVIGGLVSVVLIIFFSVAGLSGALSNYAIETEELETTLTGIGITQQELSQILNRGLGAIGSFLLPLLGGMVVTFGWVILIFIFMISAAITLPKKSRKAFSADSPIFEQAQRFTDDIQRYVSVMTSVNFLVGAGDAALLLVLGVDYAILWGLLSWFLGYIPTIGFWIALIPPTLLAWAEFGIEKALIVFLGYVLINGSVQNFIQPRMMGKGLKISPVVIFISLFFWGFMLGATGALLAVPLTLIVLTILDNFEATRWAIILVRESDESDEKARGEAIGKLRGLWGRANNSVRGGGKPDPEL